MKAVFLLLTLLAPALSMAKGATLTVAPEKPIVITADTRDSNGNTIKAPWFSFRAALDNQTEAPITIVGITLTVTDRDSAGQVFTKDLAFTPSDFTTTIPTSNGMYKCQYTHFGVFKTMEGKFLMLDGDPNLECRQPAVFLVGGNHWYEGSKLNYHVTMKTLGWFGTYENPRDRFQTSMNFVTQ